MSRGLDEMTRAQGFARGDIDTAFPLDDKFLDLRGRLTVERYYAAAGVYFHIVAATWREAERKAGLRITPDATDSLADLIAVGLLDADGRVPNRAFTNFIGRARRQRKASAERQARSRAQKSRPVTHDKRVTHGESAPLRSALNRTVGTVGTVETTGSAEGGEPDPFHETVQWLASRKAWVDSPRMQTDLARMVDKKGSAAVIAAMAEVPNAEEAAQFIYGARNALFPLNGSKTVSKDERERAEARAILAAARDQ